MVRSLIVLPARMSEQMDCGCGVPDESVFEDEGSMKLVGELAFEEEEGVVYFNTQVTANDLQEPYLAQKALFNILTIRSDAICRIQPIFTLQELKNNQIASLKIVRI